MSNSPNKYKKKDELALINALWSTDCMLYPEKFVMFNFPWGVKGKPLEHVQHPRKWQIEELKNIGEHNLYNMDRINKGQLPEPYNLSIASGRGVGKTAFMAWIILWAMSTRLGSTTVVTANTEQQLMSRTWPELGKWHTLSENSHWFERTATTLRPSKLLDMSKTGIDSAYYYAQAQLWSEENPDAFAGLHNNNGIVLLMDESSGIPQSIWDVCEGFFTEPIYLRLWITFSNPRRSSGAFYDCFHKQSQFWNTRHIDSRNVEGLDPGIFQKIACKNGEDSDVTRVEVKGQFPRTGSNQIIGWDTVQIACERHLKENEYENAAKIVGVDVARYGDDLSTIQKRQGLFAHIPMDFAKMDNMALAGVVANVLREWGADACMVGSGGGQGVIDRLRQLGWTVLEVDEGGSADRKDLYLNKRIEMWDKMAEWLTSGGVIPNHERLKEDMSAPIFKYTPTSNKKVLESVEDMKKRGLPSPDFATALALTFSYEVNPTMGIQNDGQGKITDTWDPYEMKLPK